LGPCGCWSPVPSTTSDSIRDDMLSRWIAARDGEDCLSEEELISLAFATIIGGFENVTALTALVVDEAVRFRSTETRLEVDSADSGSLPKLVREIISDVAPVNYAMRRFPLEDIAVNGITIPRGETVILSLRSANTDPARGARPDLAFGRGRHFCIGACSLRRRPSKQCATSFFVGHDCVRRRSDRSSPCGTRGSLIRLLNSAYTPVGHLPLHARTIGLCSLLE
jgi:hypothetical protein